MLLGTTFIILETGIKSTLAAVVVCPGRITINSSNLKIPYCSNKPLAQPNATVQRAVIVVHGAGRNADEYYQYIVDAANKAGSLNETIILAPQFLEEQDIKDRQPGNDILFWPDSTSAGDWRGGDDSLSTSSNPRPARISSFSAVDTMVQQLSNRTLFPKLNTIVITGHSAGAQFVSRFAAGSQVEQSVTPAGIQMRYVVANPSSYLYFNEQRRKKGTVNQFEVPTPQEISNCPNYNTYKYGLQGLNPTCRTSGRVRSGRNTRNGKWSTCSARKISIPTLPRWTKTVPPCSRDRIVWRGETFFTTTSVRILVPRS